MAVSGHVGDRCAVFATRLAYFRCFSCSTGSPQPADLSKIAGRASGEIVERSPNAHLPHSRWSPDHYLHVSRTYPIALPLAIGLGNGILPYDF